MPKLEHTGHEGEIEDVLTALETGGRPLITGDSGRLTIELITAIYKAGFEQRKRRDTGSEQDFTAGSDYQNR